MKNIFCLNCKREDHGLVRGYCRKCYSLILKIEKIERGDFLPNVLKNILESKVYNFKCSKKEYLKQLKCRLDLIRESNSFNSVSAHELESTINYTLRVLGKKSLGKFNDPIAFYLKDDKARAYVNQIFSKIQLLKPFTVNYLDIYKAGYKNKKK